MSLKAISKPSTATIEDEKLNAIFEIHVSDGSPVAFGAFVIGVSPRCVVALKTCAG